MNRLFAVLLLSALFLVGAGLAIATPTSGSTIPSNPYTVSPLPGLDPVFNFSFTGPDTGYGSLNATPLGGGEFLATTGTLTVTSVVDAGTYLLLPGGPGGTISPSGSFTYDDVLYPSSNPVLDLAGLLFTGSGLEISIFGNGPGDYWFYDSTDFNNGSEVFTLTEVVPEPASLVLLSFGLAGLWFSRRKRA